MRFITLTLNPALDLNITTITPIQPEGLNRSEAAAFSPGGKGINVSRALCALGKESDAICILGGFTGAKIRSMLTEEGVSVRVIATTAETRVNISVVTPEGKQCEINNPPIRTVKDEEDEKPGRGATAAGIRPAAETGELLSKTRILLRKLIDRNTAEGERSVVILAGSIPQDMPKTTYAELIRLCREHQAITVVDCDGEALRHALSAHPDYIKPNLDELSSLAGRRLTKEQLPQAAQEICVSTGGDTTVLATVGSAGAYLCRMREAVQASAVKVDRVRTLKGAGDTYLAAFLHYHYDCGYSEDAAMSAAARCAAKKIATAGGAFPPLG